jgi:hypothetical protein
MSDRKIILILRDYPEEPMKFAIDHYVLRWKDAGHRVIYHIGPNNIPVTDIVIVAIFPTVVSQEYVDIINKLPGVVINGKVLDTSRRRFSQLILSRTDNYTGPVIVKTNANYGGLSELYMSGERRALKMAILRAIRGLGTFRPPIVMSFLRKSGLLVIIKRLKDWKFDPEWSTVETLPILKYPVYEGIKDVPDGVWENNNLIVERFISNPENELFETHYCAFFGDKAIAGCLKSSNPIVKYKNAISDEETPIPDEVMQWKKDLNIDFGRFDYVESEGKYFLIDVNRVEGGGSSNYEYPAELDFLASGLEFYISL